MWICGRKCIKVYYYYFFTFFFLLSFLSRFRFAFGFSGELTHWDNNPAEYADSDVVTMLERLRKAGLLDDTVVIIFGDHGARYSKVGRKLLSTFLVFAVLARAR
jgi:membrane-anchored protein YejM (alkaline phosphatase superfamily)